MTAKVLDGRYKLIKTLGAGGFGRTYIARDMRRPGTPPCVVKHLKPASTDAGFIREARRLFNTEAETLEKLGKHDQIPQLLAYFEEDQQFFLVQEFIEGRSLYSEFKAPEPEKSEGEEEDITDSLVPASETKRGRQISESEVVAILKDIMNVLEFVHAEGVIHRDIKPDNLIRRKKDGKIVLIDFGAVKAMQEGGTQIEEVNGQSRFTVTVGTPGFMPSEQCAGRPTFSSDLYAAGMVAIKALTGYDPTELPTDPDTGEVVWRDKAKVSNGFAMVLTRMVRYQYTQRYQSAREVLQGLAAFAISEEESQKSVAPIVKSQNKSQGTNYTRTVAKSQTKSNSGSGLLVAGLLVMIGITTFYLTTLSRSPKIATPTTAIPSNSATTTTTTTTTATNPVTSVDPNTTGETSPAPTNTTTETPGSTTPATASNFSQSLPADVGKLIAREGTVKANQIISYTLSATEGQKLQTNISGEGITMTVLDPNNQPVDTNASQTAAWDGTLPTSGQYQIQIKTSPDKAEGNYALNVTLGEKSTVPTRSIEVQIKQ